MHYSGSYCARQCTTGEVIVPVSALHGKILWSGPGVHNNHFIDQIYVYFGDL